MARKRRYCPPATLQHVICRFLDREHRLTDDVDRETYLALLGNVARHNDWRFLGFSLMSSHVHLPVLTGNKPLQHIFKPLHVRFANAWHRRHGGLGPVLAERPANHRVRPERFGELVAYNHMDPVRNGIVQRPAESPWTSHRCYLRIESAPQWLDVERGLALCGFEDTDADRKRFDDFVQSAARRHWQRDITDMYQVVDNIVLGDMVPVGNSNRSWDDLVTAACSATGSTPSQVMSSSRCRRTTHTRRLVARIAYENFRLTLTEIAKRLNLTKSSVSYLLNDDRLHEANVIAAVKRTLFGS